MLAVHGDVAFAASQAENAGSFFDLRAGRRVGRVAPLGDELRPGRFAIMRAEFTAGGVLAYTSSNGCDGPVLHLVAPKETSKAEGA